MSRVWAASIPIGVAALPIPRMFAVMFIDMYSFAFSELLGNSRVTIGAIILHIMLDIPLFSAIFIIPVQKHIAPANENIVDTALCAPSKTALSVASIFPVAAAVIRDIIIIKLHNTFKKITPKEYIISIL